jgi:triosephosphate isomerase
MTHPARRPLIAGNWKMNGLRASESELQALLRDLTEAPAAADVVVCPPATLLSAFAMRASGLGVAIGGQDCHAAPSGAHTGDMSAEMLADAGASYVIVGHSERRADHGETDAAVRAKAAAAHRAGLIAVVCVGETLAERDAGRTLDVLGGQIDGSVPAGATSETLVVAYEPVWAIGTGRVPTLDQISEAHAFLRARLKTIVGDGAARTRILYGGSVKPQNAAEILSITDVDGALVGGASLKAADFLGIVRAV